MKKVTLLMGAMAFALVAQTEAATTKVTFVLNGYYNDDASKLTTKKVSGGIITNTQVVVKSFKITSEDVIAAFKGTNGSYLVATNRGSSHIPNEVDLVNNGTNAPLKVLDIVTTSAETYVDNEFNSTNSNRHQKHNKSTTAYNVVGVSLPAANGLTLRGTTNAAGLVDIAYVSSIPDPTGTVAAGTTIMNYATFTIVATSPAIIITNLTYNDISIPILVTKKPIFAVQGAGVSKMSQVEWSGTNTDNNTDKLSASYNNVVGTASVIPAHYATNSANAYPVTGVIVSGVIRAVRN